MFKYVGHRGSGKTESLIKLSDVTGETLVEPNFRMAEWTRMRAKEITRHDIKVITAQEYFYDRLGRRDAKYLVDELDMFLNALGINAYSDEFRDDELIRLYESERQKRGHWIHYTIDPGTELPTSYWVCDACTKKIYGVGKTMNYSFCPYCGSKMD